MLKSLIAAFGLLFLTGTAQASVDPSLIIRPTYLTTQATEEVCPEGTQSTDWIRNFIKEQKFDILGEMVVIDGTLFPRFSSLLENVVGPAPEGTDNFMALAVAPTDGSAEPRIYLAARKGNCSFGAIVIPLNLFNAVWQAAQVQPA